MESKNPTESRRTIRSKMRQRRRQLTAATQQKSAQNAARITQSQRFFINSKRLAAYLSNDGELSPEYVISKALGSRKSVYLPVLHPILHNCLWFLEYTENTPLRKNRFGILEPDVKRAKRVQPWTLNVVLMPLVAFDPKGSRLGMGGGFYDRTFSHLRPMVRRPKLIGFAHGFQCVKALPSENWDVPMTGIITEERYFQVPGRT
ncbi:5-formyltetrahydrofolate cyclo-ligase [Oleiphilus messinensis]|uniref:5-formyltetrahydrofolate cyclo-ligase n=1 Tax=Oleiphilus messinensis TaxID=141451 RepID=A0A1Y0I6B2_9GAMM|nr:5-formyltetrahydrofolate cyclo-ligase [Oleiphilus messinensis]ARU55075.1 5-formyltetrahydrofolate cyclo-ligase [Oleiphilus messinensis]